MKKEELKSLFARHTPTPEQAELMANFRKMTYQLAGTVLVNFAVVRRTNHRYPKAA